MVSAGDLSMSAMSVAGFPCAHGREIINDLSGRGLPIVYRMWHPLGADE
jgi:hypothetical protein